MVGISPERDSLLLTKVEVKEEMKEEEEEKEKEKEKEEKEEKEEDPVSGHFFMQFQGADPVGCLVVL